MRLPWQPSRFRAGQFIEVRSKEEILATLDREGCVEGIPFMPEMLKFCGQRYRVSAVAHKTCDTAKQTWKNRKLTATVHLDALRCDGSAHGGCEAECNLFWKDVWLKPVRSRSEPHPTTTAAAVTEEDLAALTTTPRASTQVPLRYSCQATRVTDASAPLAVWNPVHYIQDVLTGNHSAGKVLRVLSLSWMRLLLQKTPIGWRLLKKLHDRMHLRWSGRPAPYLNPKIQPGERTPTGRLDLQPGEYVRVKTQEEIEATLDENGRNRGLIYDKNEMASFCGKVLKVHKSVDKIIDEGTGEMIYMKQPCIMLEGATCQGEFAPCRLNCPRAIPTYWRELWLERVPSPVSVQNPTGATRIELPCVAATAQV